MARCGIAVVNITMGGRAYEPPPVPSPVAAFERAVSVMLTHAVAYGIKDDLVQRRRVWLANNPFHEKFGERQDAYWQTVNERAEVGGRMCDAAEVVGRCQSQFPADAVVGIEALTGHKLYPGIGPVWAQVAARLGTTDLFAIAMEVGRTWSQGAVEPQDEKEGLRGSECQ